MEIDTAQDPEPESEQSEQPEPEQSEQAEQSEQGAGMPPAAAATDRDRLVDWCTLGALVALSIPLVVALASVGRTHWWPTGDMAQAELHMRGFFGHPPLVGAAGRIGDISVPFGQGSHPGPAMWVAMLPVYLLHGRSSFGLMAAVTVVQLFFLVLTVWLVRRLAGREAGLVVATAGAVLVHSLGPAPFIEPWNPWLGIFAFFCCVAAAWGVLCGRHRWLWLATFTGLFAVQCHAGYIPIVGVLLAVLSGLTLWRWRRDRPTGYARWWWAAVGTFVAMWIPPLIDQWRRDPGNLRILFHHFTSTTEPDGTPRSYVGISGALKAFVGEFSVTGPWIRGSFRQPGDSPNVLTFLLAVAVVIAAVVLVRRRGGSAPHEVSRLGAMLAGLIAIGVLATSRIFGEFYDYVIRWWWVLIAWTAIAVVLVLLGRVQRQRAHRAAAASMLAISCLAAGFASANAAGISVPSPRNSALVGGVTADAEPHLSHAEKYLVRWYDPASLGGVPYGVILELERDGFHVGVDAWGSAAALPHRVLAENDADAVLWVVSGKKAIDDFRTRADATELGFYDQRTPAEVIRSDELRAELERRLTELGLACMIPTLDTQYGLAPLVIGNAPVPQDVKVLAGDYNLLELPVAIFSLPTGSPGYAVITPGCD